jgi:hypothetical protein
MALKTITIGGNKDVIQYDDADFDYGFDSEGPIRVQTAPVNPDEVLRKADAPGAGSTGDVVGPAGATDSVFSLFDGATGKLLREAPIKCSDPIKSGATQAAAGAAAGELWVTSGHASLPDNVLMLGV